MNNNAKYKRSRKKNTRGLKSNYLPTENKKTYQENRQKEKKEKTGPAAFDPCVQVVVIYPPKGGAVESSFAQLHYAGVITPGR